MKKIQQNIRPVCQSLLCLVAILLIILCTASKGHAQQPSAEITQLSGAVFVSIQGTGDIEATVGTVLKPGDTIETKAGAGAVLTLSEGSEIRLGENSKLDLSILTQTPEGARKSRLKLLWGRIRMWLSPEHQKGDSSFTVETLNAQVGVKFSQPDIEVAYDSSTNITIIRAYTVAVSVINLLTGAEVTSIPPKHQAIVKEDVIIVSKITEVSTLLERIGEIAADEQEVANMNTLIESRQIATSSVSSVRATAAAGTGNFGNTRTERPERRTEPVGVTLTIAPE